MISFQDIAILSNLSAYFLLCMNALAVQLKLIRYENYWDNFHDMPLLSINIILSMLEKKISFDPKHITN